MSPTTPSPMIATLLILGGAVFGVLGVRNPQYLVPVDPSVAQAMANSALRLSGGRTNMWRTWIGFNFSHSLGLLLVAGLAQLASAKFSGRRIPEI